MADRELREKIEVCVDRQSRTDSRSDGETKNLTRSREMNQIYLLDSSEFREKIVETLPLLIWIFDLKLQSLVYTNALTSVFLGYSDTTPREPTSISHLLEPTDMKILEAAMRRLVTRRHGDIVDTSFRVRRLDGTSRWLSTRMSVFDTDSAGSVTRIIGGSIDVTEGRRAEERISRLSQESSIARARERREIASLLHDSIGQLLPVANAKLALLRNRVDEVSREQIEEVQALIVEAHSTASSLTTRLSPPAIHEIGLAASLQALARDIRRQHDLKVELEIEQERIPLSEAMEYTIYRVIRELLVNIAKHSGSSKAWIRASRCGPQIQIVVEDFGVGFEPAECNSRGLGLRSAQDRLDYLGARMDIHSRPGAGTRIVLRAPLLTEDSVEHRDRK